MSPRHGLSSPAVTWVPLSEGQGPETGEWEGVCGVKEGEKDMFPDCFVVWNKLEELRIAPSQPAQSVRSPWEDRTQKTLPLKEKPQWHPSLFRHSLVTHTWSVLCDCAAPSTHFGAHLHQGIGNSWA